MSGKIIMSSLLKTGQPLLFVSAVSFTLIYGFKMGVRVTSYSIFSSVKASLGSSWNEEWEQNWFHSGI